VVGNRDVRGLLPAWQTWSLIDYRMIGISMILRRIRVIKGELRCSQREL
jgi:hypothetical protein